LPRRALKPGLIEVGVAPIVGCMAKAGVSRRELLIAGATAAISGVAVLGANRLADGWSDRSTARTNDRPNDRPRGPAGPPADEREFRDEARRIKDLHRGQTLDEVASLKKRYESPVFGKKRVWELIEDLGRCVDQSDTTLFCTSQWVHVQQVLAGMQRDRIDDPDMLLMALLHDVGKVLLLAGAAPDHVVGATKPVGEYADGVGLDRVVCQYGHPEFIYSRMKDHVPDAVAWMLRYHGCPLDDMIPLMDARDRDYHARYFTAFRKYDAGTKSMTRLPALDWKPYRALIEERFPNPVLV